MSDRPIDVLIIGAGIVGCTIAFELAATGRRVRLLDPRPPGEGATRASAGVLAPYVEGHDRQPLRALGQRSIGIYEAFVERVRQQSGRPVEFRHAGTVEAAVNDADIARLARSRATAEAEGIACRWLESGPAHEMEPALGPHVVGALHIPFHAAVDAQALTAAALHGARTRGADVVPARVTQLARDGAALAVHTDGGVERAPQVVLATGAWSAGLAPPGADPAPVRPVRGQILHLAAPPATLGHILWGTDVYLVPWTSGTIFVGATSEDVGFDERATAGGVAALLERAVALVPSLAEATFLEARYGLRPGSPDDLPFVGPSAVLPGLVYACGHYRNGALLAPLTAGLVARVIDGDLSDPALDGLAPSRAGRL